MFGRRPYPIVSGMTLPLIVRDATTVVPTQDTMLRIRGMNCS